MYMPLVTFKNFKMKGKREKREIDRQTERDRQRERERERENATNNEKEFKSIHNFL